MPMPVPLRRHPGARPAAALADLQLHVRIRHSDHACDRGHETPKPNDASVGLVDPQLVQRDQDVTEVLHCVQEQREMLLQGLE